MKTINFAKGQWAGNELIECYSFRFTETPKHTQFEDCIGNKVNPDHREGFDNISFVTEETYAPGVKASLRCAFVSLGCPEIILVPETETTKEGSVQYGACFEVVLYKDGVNVWRHFMEKDYSCHWHKRLGVEYPVTENDVHTLTVETKENYIIFSVDGKKTTLRTEDLPERFHIGITMCEGIVRLYDFTVE
ncbi:MAG: hypothetical protein IJC48_09165 [Clostridia bacterium]|nr:hypothetical protein [Clostridia bacterium]